MADKKSKVNDEIDLMDLFNRIGKALVKGFVGLFRLIVISVAFLFQNWLILGVSLVSGVGLSFLMPEIMKPLYNAEIVIRSNAIPNHEVFQYINRLNLFCEEKNRNALNEALGLSQEDIYGIVDIEAFWVIDRGSDSTADFVDYKDRHAVYDTLDVRMADRLAIRYRTRNPEQFESVKNGILSYIQNNQLFIQRNQFRLDQVDQTLARLDYDVEQLDSLQKVKYFEETRRNLKEGSGQMVFLQEQRTQLIYQDIYNLFNQKQDLEREKGLYPEIITLITDFTPSSDQLNGPLYYGKYIIPILLGFTLLILILIVNKKRLVSLINN